MSTQLMTGPVTAYGQVEAGKMTAASLREQADLLTAEAQEAEDKGQYDANRSDMVANQRIGTSIAAFGASGVDTTSGSVLDVIKASHQNAEMDRLSILHGADIKAINYRNQASMNRFGAESAIRGAYWAALGSVVGAGINSDAWNKSAKPNNSSAGGEADGMAAENASAESGGEGASMGEAGAGAGGEAGAADAAALA